MGSTILHNLDRATAVMDWQQSRGIRVGLVLTRETGSAQVLATATLGLILPTVLLGPLVGAYVDRWNRRLTILISDTFIALMSLFLAYLFWTGNMEVWHVYVIIVARAIGASTTMLVPSRHLTRVAGLNQSMSGAMQVAGPMMAPFLSACSHFTGSC